MSDSFVISGEGFILRNNFCTLHVSVGGKGVYNVQLIRSTNNGVTWGGHVCISSSPIDQWYPDVKMIDVPSYGKIVFVVWQETDNPINSPSAICTKAVYFSNFNNVWYGKRTLIQSNNLYNYPRIAGTLTDCASNDGGNTAYDLMRLHFVWEAYVGQGPSTHWEIQMNNMYWENDGIEGIHWGSAFPVAWADYVDLRHPSIDAGVPYGDDEIGSGNNEHVVLTYDCRWRDIGIVDARFKYLPFNGQSNLPSSNIGGMGDLIFPTQNSFYYPDTTIWGYKESVYPYNWRWETVVVGQKDSSNYIAGRASINLGVSWGSEVNVGSMGQSSPQLRGVAIDSGIGDGDYWTHHPGGIYVIWDIDKDEMGQSASEIRSRRLGITPSGILNSPDPTYGVDTTGLYSGDLRYVATSITYCWNSGYREDYTHNLYNIVVGSSVEPIWTGSVVYYRQP